jgi:hypothetical protein
LDVSSVAAQLAVSQQTLSSMELVSMVQVTTIALFYGFVCVLFLFFTRSHFEIGRWVVHFARKEIQIEFIIPIQTVAS